MVSGTSQQQLVPNLGQPTLDSALKQGKDSLLLLLSLLYQSSTSAPLPLVPTFTVGGSLGWVELTQLLRAGLRSLLGLKPRCSHPVGTK